jgi:hypothetical protein
MSEVPRRCPHTQHVDLTPLTLLAVLSAAMLVAALFGTRVLADRKD